MRARYERRGLPCAPAFKRSAWSDRRTLRLKDASITGEQNGGLRGVVTFAERSRQEVGGEVHLVESADEWLLDMDLSCITPTCEP